MPFRLKLGKPLQTSVRRILCEQCERAERALSQSADPVKAVHDARRGLKRMRALLRLVREGLERQRWQQENTVLRDIGRRLSASRDQDVRRQIIARLAEDGPADLQAALARLEAIVADQPSAVMTEDRGDVLRATAHALATCRKRLAKLELHGDDLAILAAGLARCHRRGRRTLAAAEAEPSDLAMHELRKAVQVHWRQTSVLSAAWPDVMQARANAARGLSGVLGAHNDLALLVHDVQALRDRHLPRGDASLILAACRSRQTIARREALLEARRLFAGKPKGSAQAVLEAWCAAGGLARPRDKTET